MTNLISLFGCKIPAPDPQNPTPDFNSQQMTDVEQRLARLAQLVGSSSSQAPNNQAARAMLFRNMTRMSELSSAHSLSPHRASNFAMFKVRDLGMVNHFLGIGDGYTDLGWVRASQIKARRLAGEDFSRTMRELGVQEAMASRWQEFNRLLDSFGVRNRRTRRYIATQVQELGWFPYIRNAGGTNVVANTRMNEKYAAFVDELTNRFGLSPQQADQLLELGARSAEIYHEIAVATRQLSINLDEVEQLGYFPRIMSDEVRRLLNWKWQDLQNGVLEGTDGSRVSVSAAAMKARTTYEFLAEDEIVLDYVLRNFSLNQFGDAGQLYKEVTGVAGAGISDVLDNHRALIPALRSVLDTRPDLLSQLFDLGILTKAPFTSSEVVDYLKNSLELPIEGLADVFESDWNRGLKLYTEQLNQLARQSGQVQLIVRNSLDAGWGVPARDVAQNPGLYGDWIPFLSLDDSRPSVFTHGLLDKYMFTQGVIQGDPVLSQLYTTYVHPDVANIIKSTMATSTSPGALAVLARGIRGVNRLFGSLAIASFEYIPRQFISSFFQLGAGGGDLNALTPAVTKLTLYQLGLGDRVFDDTRRIYQDGLEFLTEREVFHRLQDRGYIDRFEPLTGTQLDPTKYHAWNPTNVRANARYFAYVLQNQGLGGAVSEVGRSIGQTADRLSYVPRLSNNIFDNAGRFSGVLSSMRTGNSPVFALPLGDISRAVTSGGVQKFDTIDEAIEHWSRYFFFFDDRSPLDRNASMFVPFWGFWGKMLPAAVRHVVRHPTRFMAYERLYQLLESSGYESGDFTESSVNPWLQSSSPVYLRMPDGNGGWEHHAIPMDLIDPFQAAFNMIEGIGEGVADLFGIPDHNRSTAEKLGDRPWANGRTSRLLEELVELTWPVVEASLNQIAGEDVLTDRPLDGPQPNSFLGYDMDRGTQMWIETLLPFLRTVDSINPGGVFGRPERRDSMTGEITPGSPSQMPFSGNPIRTNPETFNADNRYANLRWTGVKIYPVDIAFNSGRTYDSLRIDISNARKYVQTLREQSLRLEEGSDQWQDYQQRIAETQFIIDETRVQLQALEMWANDRGISIREASVRLRAQGRRIGDLPRAPQSEQREVETD